MTKRKASRKPPAPKKPWFPRIKKLTPRGFLSFAPDFPGVELGDLNVFIGANGSGKSNFFEAARFLQEAQKDLGGFLGRNGSTPADWCFQGDERTSGPSVTCEFDAFLPVEYELGFRPAGLGSVEITEERARSFEHDLFSRSLDTLKWNRPDKAKPLTEMLVTPSATALDSRRSPNNQADLDVLRSSLSALRFYADAGFGGSNPIRRGQRSVDTHFRLLEDGSNLALYLSGLLQFSGFRQSLLDHMAAVLPDVSDIGIDIGLNVVQVVLEMRGSRRRTPASRVSDGTLRWLMLGAVLLSSDRLDMPYFINSPVFIDEPELGLHPDAIAALGRLIQEASTRRQVIVNTHSSLLLSAFTSTPECVYAFDRDQYGTRVERLDSKLIKSWVERGESLGGIWAAGAIGGNRW